MTLFFKTRSLALAGAALLAWGVAAPASAQAVSHGIPVTSGGNILAPGAPMPPLGRAGPPGSFVSEIDMAPTCMVAMSRAGFYARKVSCPSQLATKPGLTAQCIGSDGRRTASAITTFIDFDPATGRASTHCAVKSVIGG